MATRMVEVVGTSAASPDAVWAISGDFAGAWHPLIDTISAERDGRGALIRAFTVKGEDTLYREQLVYRSDSDRTLTYVHLQGIRDVDLYRASMRVTAGADGGSEITLSAEIDAQEPRATAIAEGTQAIFEIGLRALADLKPQSAAAPPIPSHADSVLRTIHLSGQPALALTATPDTDGPLVLFLHGIGGGRGNWTQQLLALSGRYRAAALDLRGYGDSRLGENPSTPDDYCADILRVADYFGADRLVLCGLSYGAWIATGFAMRFPERLAGLVLSGGCTGMSEAPVEERERFLKSRQAPLDAGLTPADFAADVVAILAGPAADDAVRAQLQASMAAIPAATYRDAVTCFTHPPERFDFSRLTMPVLMMTGEFDRLAPPDEIRGVAARIVKQAPLAHVRYETIAAAGHVCNVEQPGRYSAILRAFLESLPA